MIKELATLILVVFVVLIYFVVAPAALEPINDAVRDHSTNDDIPTDKILDRQEDFAFMWAPLFAIGGTMVWVFFRTFRREDRLGRGGFGGV